MTKQSKPESSPSLLFRSFSLGLDTHERMVILFQLISLSHMLFVGAGPVACWLFRSVILAR